MSDRAVEALFHYLEADEAVRIASKRALFLRARFAPQLKLLADRELHCCQTFKRDAEQLENAGFTVVTKPETGYDLCLYLGTKQRDENLANFAQGIRALHPGGLFVCCLMNEVGAARFEKELGSLGELALSYAKSHARVFGIRSSREVLASPILSEWQRRGEPITVPGTSLFSRPGIFAWDKVDRGSELLVSHLPVDLRGVVADLGSGYGYLAAKVLETSPNVTELCLFEAEKLGLEVSERSFAKIKASTKINYYWHDVTTGLPRKDFDTIITNPPFHTGRQTSFALGEKFVQVAAAALKPQGQLYLVANMHLPYERLLGELFSSQEQIASRIGFKVLKAIK